MVFTDLMANDGATNGAARGLGNRGRIVCPWTKAGVFYRTKGIRREAFTLLGGVASFRAP